MTTFQFLIAYYLISRIFLFAKMFYTIEENTRVYALIDKKERIGHVYLGILISLFLNILPIIGDLYLLLTPLDIYLYNYVLTPERCPKALRFQSMYYILLEEGYSKEYLTTEYYRIKQIYAETRAKRNTPSTFNSGNN